MDSEYIVLKYTVEVTEDGTDVHMVKKNVTTDIKSIQEHLRHECVRFAGMYSAYVYDITTADTILCVSTTGDGDERVLGKLLDNFGLIKNTK